MGVRRIDAMAVRLAGRPRSRRGAVRFVAGAALASLLGRAGIGDVGAAATGCAKVGRRCIRGAQCCSGLCLGKRGGKTCRGHGAGTCKQGQNACTVPNPRTLLCNNDEYCVCLVTTAGTSFCANGRNLTCVDCARDADCLAMGYPAGSACVVTAVGACSGLCESGATCFAPCGTDSPAPSAGRRPSGANAGAPLPGLAG